MRDAARARREAPPPKNVVEIIDSMTLRRNGVLMKKKYVQTSDGGLNKRRYTWVKAGADELLYNSNGLLVYTTKDRECYRRGNQ